MPGRLAKVNCPHCGAPIRVDVTSQFAACDYCKRTSFVHRPKEPIAPVQPGYESYGHIQLPPSAVRSPLLFPLLIAFFGFDILVVIGVAVALIAARASSSAPSVTTTSPASPTVPAARGTPDLGTGPCATLVRCCKAIQPENTACNMMIAIPEADCARQVPQMQQAARAMGRRCD